MAKDEKGDLKSRSIKTAQDRKDLSIAFFNATNSAIELMKIDLTTGEVITEEMVKVRISEWRQWFLKEHAEYRESVLEHVGATYSPKSVIEKMEATTNAKELETVWLSLTEDERRDNDIHAKCRELVVKYKTVQI